jgi:cytochrome P450
MQTRISDKPQTFVYENRPIKVPAGATMLANITGLQYNPRYWGDKANEFMPRRWENVKYEEGAFAAFGHGSHACIGKRFSEVEFVSVLSELLKEHRVELVRIGEETEDLACKRARRSVERSGMYLTVSVGGDVPLRFVRRVR